MSGVAEIREVLASISRDAAGRYRVEIADQDRRQIVVGPPRDVKAVAISEARLLARAVIPDAVPGAPWIEGGVWKRRAGRYLMTAMPTMPTMTRQNERKASGPRV
jgi:hypothetical protein